MQMRIECAWCRKTVRESAQHLANQPVSHGICMECAAKLVADMSKTLDSFLNRFEFPIVVVDVDAALVAANRHALRKKAGRFEIRKGARVGDLIECIHSYEAGGCGRTVHCRACTIRNLVKSTYTTGIAAEKVPATADIAAEGASEKIQYLITTEKIGDFVALKIENVIKPSEQE